MSSFNRDILYIMTNILVLTDFSEVANFGISTAVQLALTNEAKIHILHNMENDEFIEINLGKENYYRIGNVSDQQLDMILNEWNQIAEEKKLSFYYRATGSDLIENIKKFIIQQDIDLVIMGATGKGKKWQQEWGSTTEKVIKNINIPVLIVKEHDDEFILKTIVFASSFDAIEKETFRKFLQLIPLEKDATIHLLTINTESYFTQPSLLAKEAMNDYKEIARPIHTKTHFYRDYNINSGIRHFNDQIKPDLVVMSNKIKKPIKHILVGNEAVKLANRSTFPVLIMDY